MACDSSYESWNSGLNTAGRWPRSIQPKIHGQGLSPRQDFNMADERRQTKIKDSVNKVGSHSYTQSVSRFVGIFYRLKGVIQNDYLFFNVSVNKILKCLSRLGFCCC